MVTEERGPPESACWQDQGGKTRRVRVRMGRAEPAPETEATGAMAEVRERTSVDAREDKHRLLSSLSFQPCVANHVSGNACKGGQASTLVLSLISVMCCKSCDRKCMYIYFLTSCLVRSESTDK